MLLVLNVESSAQDYSYAPGGLGMRFHRPPRGLAVAMFAVAFLVASLPSAATSGPPFVADEILLSLSPGAAAQRSESALEASWEIAALDAVAFELPVVSVEPLFAGEDKSALAVANGLDRIFKVRLGPGVDIFAAIDAYSSLAEVEFAEPNWTVRALVKPNDPELKEQWALENDGSASGKKDADIDATAAWDLERGDKSVLIAVIDTGVDYQHPDLAKGRIRTDIDRDFVNRDGDARDDHGHGTYVAGIIAAATNNAKGIAGVCWSCSILPLKVLDEDGTGTAAWLAKALRYAADKGARIANMSLSFGAGCGCSKTVAATINYAFEAGVLLVGASGNDSDKEDVAYPASSTRVLSVGASDRTDQEADFSNRDSALDLWAPGRDILGLDATTGGYDFASGTSAAAPHVAGVAGLLLSKTPGLRHTQVWQILRASADRLSSSQARRRLNAQRALKSGSTVDRKAPSDTCSTEPDCPPGCAAEVALAPELGFPEVLGVLWRLRSEVLESTVQGRAWARLYEQHQREIALLLLARPALRDQTRSALAGWIPLFRDVLEPGASQATLTASTIAATLALFAEIEALASPELRRTVVDERARLVEHFLHEGYDATALRRALEAPR